MKNVALTNCWYGFADGWDKVIKMERRPVVYEREWNKDAGVLKYTGLKAGQEMTFAEFERIVEEKILQPGYGRVICGDCQWRDICHK